MKRLLLIGGGHAHVHVLDALAKQAFANTEVTLVSPYPRQIYSGMLPGWIAGDYRLDQCAIPIDRLARRGNVRFIESACTRLDLVGKQAYCADGKTIDFALDFDFVSIDSGPTVGTEIMRNASESQNAPEFLIPIRPIEEFVAAWPKLLEHAGRQTAGFTLAIVGDGAAGTELAFTIDQRFKRERFTHAKVMLIGTHDEPLPGQPAGLRRAAGEILRERGIRYLAKQRASGFRAGGIDLVDGSSVECGATLLVTGAAAPAWPSESGLACDEKGFITVGNTLQSRSHDFVLAAGDVAAYLNARPKSGVFAVRAGPILAANLRALCAGEALQPWTPQVKALYLISTGTQHALASWGKLSCGKSGWFGGLLWRWKDRIDRGFMQRFS